MKSKRKRSTEVEKIDEAVVISPDEDQAVADPASQKLIKKTKADKRELLENVNIALIKRKRLDDPPQVVSVNNMYDSELRCEIELPSQDGYYTSYYFQRNCRIIFNKACTQAVAVSSLSSPPAIWDLESNSIVRTLSTGEEIFAFNNQGTQLICSPSQNIIDASTGEVICNMGSFEDTVGSVLFSGDDTKVLFSFKAKYGSGGRRSYIQCRNVADATMVCEFQSDNILGTIDLLMTACVPGSPLCVTPDCVKLIVWNCNGEIIKFIPGNHGTTPKAVCICGQDDLVCVVYDTGISMYNTTTETLLWKKRDFFHWCPTMLFSRLDQAVIIFSQWQAPRYEQDTKVKVLDVTNGGHLFATSYSWYTKIVGIGCPETESVVLL